LHLLYIFLTPSGVDKQLHKCQEWWVDVQCVCLIKVKVKVQGQTLYNCITCPLYNSWRFGDILKGHGTNVKYNGTMCREHFWPRSHQGQGDISRSNTLCCVCSISFEDFQVQGHSSRLNILWLVPFTMFSNSNYLWNKLTPFPMLQQMGNSSLPVLPVIAQVSDHIFIKKNNCFHPVTYGGHDCFCF